MYNASSGWLMTTLAADPLTVSLIQVASNLPMFLFALPAGALADIVDKRRYLITIEVLIAAAATLSALLVWAQWVTPPILLLLNFLLGAGAALTAPAWQSVVPQLVPKSDLAAAVAANGVGVNISRAIGPALGGFIIGAAGMSPPFWLNAVSNVGVIGALWWWTPAAAAEQPLPAERLANALIVGFRHARYNPNLRSTLARAATFFFSASAYWALLPLVARSQIVGGPALYGTLLGAIGGGAVLGAFLLPKLKAHFDADRLVALGTAGTAFTLLALGFAHAAALGLFACGLAGMSWIVVLSSLNFSAQLALPDWVRGRGLAMFVTVFFGSMTLGSTVWGQLASVLSLPAAHFIAAACALIGIPLSWRFKLQSSATTDLTPSMHWPTPVLTLDVPADRGSVLVTIEYTVEAHNRAEFLRAIELLGEERRRDGAYAWDIYEDAAQSGRFLETFQVASWIEHLRQHQRVTQADRTLQDRMLEYSTQSPPKITHFLAVSAEQQEAGSSTSEPKA